MKSCACRCSGPVPWKKVYWWLEMLIPIAIAFPFLFKFIYVDRSRPSAGPCLGVTIITAAYWIFEPIPIVITAFFPVFLLPLFTVSTATSIASSMFTDTSMIFIGGFIFSIVMVKWNLHSRIALKTVLIFGLRPKLLLLGICLVTTFFSLLISNTACALTMIPNALAIINKLEDITGDPEGIAPFAKSLLLMIAMTCSTAGMITIIGTPPNLILAQTVQNIFPDAPDIGFAQFMFVSLPTSAVMLVFLYLYFIIVYMRKVCLPDNIDESDFRDNYNKLGKMKPPEIVITVMFVILALLWFLRSDINFGSATMTGWATLIYGSKGSTYIKDGTIAIFLSMMFYIIKVPAPATSDNKRPKADVDMELRAQPDPGSRFRSPLEMESSDGYEEEDREEGQEDEQKKADWIPMLDWETTQQKMPWTILFLFSGGFALNQGFKDSGLDVWIGNQLSGLTSLDTYPLSLVITAVTILMTNIVASNTAVANILLPIVASVAKTSGTIHPFKLMFPTAFACSYCFIMPVATPPNLIAYSTGRLETKDFIITGAFLTVIALLVVPAFCTWLVGPVFDADSFPVWAGTNTTV